MRFIHMADVHLGWSRTEKRSGAARGAGRSGRRFRSLFMTQRICMQTWC